MSSINQKEYLKKYLGIGKAPGEKKKKKKKDKLTSNRLKIIDDDADTAIASEIQDDIAAANEDAPQIVAVFDERPPSLRIDEKTKSKLWKPIGENSEINEFDNSPPRKRTIEILDDYSPPRRNQKSVDLTPPRASNNSPSRIIDDDYSPPRKRKSQHDNLSPTRRNVVKSEPDFHTQSGSKSKNGRDDCSPPRRSSDHANKIRQSENNHSPTRIKIETDMSPARKIKNKSDDYSPPRRNRDRAHESTQIEIDNSPHKTMKDNDMSPRRKGKNKSDDYSPPRRNRDRDTGFTQSENDHSPHRTTKDTDISSSRRKGNSKNDDYSPPRKSRTKKSRWESGSNAASSDVISEDVKMTKTLDGKTAGLQNAADLVKETQIMKRKEDEMFKKMSAEVSGVNAATVVRGRKIRDFEEEARQKQLEKENKEKYNRWGRGLKQVEHLTDKIAEEQYEMTKPLARYADDKDLEKYLKDQEREGDPMLAYIRKKRHTEIVKSGVPVKPQYMGEFLPNRFGITPGYRWDGVDRSNGYEKKWFDVQNARKASQEESYKWSTEDM